MARRWRRYKNGDRGQTYNFSRVFGGDTAQEAFYQATAAPMVRQVTRARHSSVLMAYGISAAGKTHTVEARAHPPRNICFVYIVSQISVFTTFVGNIKKRKPME